MKRELMQRERITITKNDFSREAEDKIESVRNYMFAACTKQFRILV